ncbi:hypothetical protein [Pseudonocardia abyssalis]|jgi:hypothetical protein|uniref:Uncharacterized protein n=1 Tax=Pseudonocardia abyssalis TaxID=2792008 RepID=A0ABS6UYT7_9PSEU|nr:hypothetical protein [Pseudonocardia abyssalis]MBW0115645.1 hypothetical protein [Pseudonocardia abyssalis]MBW0137435.1 hypothetical protein [Pseudonocardia abyssalis]
MRLGDAPDGSRLAEAVPITSRSGGLALLDADDLVDGLAPPWRRMPVTPPAERLAAAPVPPAPRPSADRPVRPVTELATRREHRPPVPSARPRVVEEPSILGLSRRARSRLGSRLFTLFFVAVFSLIALQMVLAILYG